MRTGLNVEFLGAILAMVSLGSWAADVNDLTSAAPALEKYTQERLLGEVWKRPQLSARDRSITTVAALIARNQVNELPR